jgi:hypothetical protein
MRLPETVKSIEVHALISEAAPLEGHKYDIKIARDEVMVLLSLYYWWYGVLNAGANTVNIGLWRKTDSNPPVGIWAAGALEDMVWSKQETVQFVTESVKASSSEHVIFPRPIVLIRPPRLLLRTSFITGVAFSVRLYYQLVNVTPEELTKLMVKDHA